MKLLVTIAIAGAVGGIGVSSANAQSVGIGSTKGGATAQVSAAIAKVVSAHAGLQMRPQPYANTSQYIPVVNGGKLEFGVANIFQATFATKGTGMSEGRPNPNLQMVATLMAFRVGYYVARDSGIKSFADLKGKKVPSFKPTALGSFILNGYLANVGISTDGMNLVSVPNFPRMWDGFKRGTLDTAIAAIGSRPTRDMKATLGALRILPLDPSPAAVERMREFLPQAYVVKMAANPKLPGLQEATNVGAFDYTLFASKDASADVVYKVTKALYENEKELHAAAPLWRGFKASGMSKDVGLTYHPGAIKFYREKGMWTR